MCMSIHLNCVWTPLLYLIPNTGVTEGRRSPYGWWELNLGVQLEQYVLSAAILFFLMSRWGCITVWTQHPGSCPVSSLWDVRTKGARAYTGNNCPKWRDAKQQEQLPPDWLSLALRKMRRGRGRKKYEVDLWVALPQGDLEKTAMKWRAQGVCFLF